MHQVHDISYPQSDEPAESVSDRFVKHLEYEERARIGFRRRGSGDSDPYADPDQFLVTREPSKAEVIGNYLSAAGLIIGAFALVYRPLLTGTLGLALAVAGAAMPGRNRIGYWAVHVAWVCFAIGMIFFLIMEWDVF